MSATIATGRVKDIASFKKEFDGFKDLRVSSGGTIDHVYHDADDPNKMTIIIKWPSTKDARKFFNSPQVKAVMEKQTSQGKIEYLEE